MDLNDYNGIGKKMNEKKILEKWLKQIKSGELNPDAIGLGEDRNKAIEKINSELNKLSHNKTVLSVKGK